jgi:hypothetical protein
MWMRSLVSPFARLVVALKDRRSSLDGDTCFCLSDAVCPMDPPVVAAGFLGLPLPVLVFLVFILFISN